VGARVGELVDGESVGAGVGGGVGDGVGRGVGNGVGRGVGGDKVAVGDDVYAPRVTVDEAVVRSDASVFTVADSRADPDPLSMAAASAVA